jgi:hypothetical protein
MVSLDKIESVEKDMIKVQDIFARLPAAVSANWSANLNNLCAGRCG